MPAHASNLHGETRRVALTPAVIAKLIAAHRNDPAAPARTTVADLKCPGLRLVIGPRAASFIYSYRARGTTPDGRRHPQRTVVIGDAAELHPDDARHEAVGIKRAVRDGRDPAGERDAVRAGNTMRRQAALSDADSRAAMIQALLTPPATDIGRTGRVMATALNFSVLAYATLDQCAAAYALHAGGGGEGHRTADLAHLRRALGDLQAGRLLPSELRKPAIAGLVRHHADRPATARHRLGAVNRLYKFLLAADAVQFSPTLGITSPAPPPPRSRVFTAAEVKRLWDSADALPSPRRDYLRLAILLPLRRTELAGLRSGSIQANGDRLEVVIAAADAKNRQEHRLPLVGAARLIVERLLAADPLPSGYLIPLTATGRAMNAWKRLTESIRSVSGVADFNIHDFRRLFASKAGEHGIGDFTVIDGLLNHSASSSKVGAARAYHHARMTSARTAVMAAWDGIVDHARTAGRWPREVEADSNVIPLTTRSVP